jgi:CheY-like chemotaxis protein
MPSTVLVAEDHEELIELYETALRQAGYNVVEARNGMQTIRLLDSMEPPPDVVYLDIEMPDLPGTRALDHIRQTPRLQGVRVIVITANEGYRDRVGDLADAFIVKPISLGQLLELTARLARKPG